MSHARGTYDLRHVLLFVAFLQIRRVLFTGAHQIRRYPRRVQKLLRYVQGAVEGVCTRTVSSSPCDESVFAVDPAARRLPPLHGEVAVSCVSTGDQERTMQREPCSTIYVVVVRSTDVERRSWCHWTPFDPLLLRAEPVAAELNVLAGRQRTLLVAFSHLNLWGCVTSSKMASQQYVEW